MKRKTLLTSLLATAVLALTAGPVAAQTKLKWAHVYETTEPYHTECVWAADEIKKRTNGKFEIQVFPASSLGKETDINQGLQLGTVDMIISGPSFAARSYPRLGIAYYPFIFRDADHLTAYSKSDVFKEMVDGFREKTGIQILAYTYYGARHATSNNAVHRLRRHEGPEDPRARRAGLHAPRRAPAAPTRRRSPSPRSTWRCRTARSTRRRTRCTTIEAKKFYEVQKHIMLTGHIVDGADHAGGAARVEQADRRREEDLLRRGAGGRRARHRRDQEARGASWSTSSRRRAWASTRSTARASVDAVLKTIDRRVARLRQEGLRPHRRDQVDWHRPDCCDGHRCRPQGDGRRRRVPRHRRSRRPVATRRSRPGWRCGSSGLLGGVVFYQFFTRYVLNDSAAWTEEIARYLLIGIGLRRRRRSAWPRTTTSRSTCCTATCRARGRARAGDRGRRAAHRLLRRDGGAHAADDAEDGQLPDDHRRPADEHRLRRVPVRLRRDDACARCGSCRCTGSAATACSSGPRPRWKTAEDACSRSSSCS